MVKEYVFEGSHARTIIRIINADESLEADLTKAMQKQRKPADARESLETDLAEAMQKPCDLVDADESLDAEFDEEIPKPRNLVHHLLEKQQEKERAQHLEFLEILKSKDVVRVCGYCQKHRLIAADEYQVLVFFATEIEDDQESERLISDYVYRYGVNSLKAKLLLRDLKFDKVVNATPEDDEDSLEEEYSLNSKLSDGFMMLRDDI